MYYKYIIRLEILNDLECDIKCKDKNELIENIKLLLFKYEGYSYSIKYIGTYSKEIIKGSLESNDLDVIESFDELSEED